MLSRRTTAWLLASVGFAAAVAWLTYRTVPADGGEPRSRLLLRLDVEALDSLLIELGDVTLVCQRRQGTWWLTRPIAARADEERIHRLLDALALAPVLDILTPDEQRRHQTSQRDYGLAPPRARILLRGPNEPPVELRVGMLAAHGASLYVGFTGSAPVYVTDPALFGALPTSIGDLRDRALLPYPIDRLRRFELRSPGQPLVAAERDGAGLWWLRQPEVRRADAGAIAALLGYVADAKIETFVHTGERADGGVTGATSATLGIAYGCHPDEAAMVARFWFAGNRPTPEFHELLFGKAVADAPGRVYALSSEEQLVVTVDGTLPRALRVNPEDLRDRHVWPLAADTVQRLRVRGETEAVTLERLPGEGWTITQPIQAPAQNDTCSALLTAVLGLEDVTVADAAAPPPHDVLVELTSSAPDGVHTALVSQAITAADGRMFLDWYLPATRQAHRVDAAQLPPQFGRSSFFATLRDLVVLRLDATALAGIGQQFGTNAELRASCARDGGWSANAPATASPATNALQSIAATVSGLRAARVEALVSASLDTYGLREPACALTLDLQGTESQTRILLLGRTEERGGRFAIVKGYDSVFVLTPEDTATLMRPILTTP